MDFDKIPYYNNNIAGLVGKIRKECELGSIPFYFSAAVKADGRDVIYIRDGITPDALGIDMDNSEITAHFALAAGLDCEQRVEEDFFDDGVPDEFWETEL